MALVPQNQDNLNRRSVDVTRTYLQRGQGVTRSMWVNISPRNPVLKAVVAVPAAAVMLSMFLLMMLMLGFVLLSVTLMWALSGKSHREIR
jgi:hypothetical protein